MDVSHQAEAESTARAKSQRRQKNGGNYPGWGVGRIQKSWTAKAAGTAAPSIAPAQGEGVDVSHQAEAESTARAKSQRRQKNGGNYPGRGVGRIQKSWTAKGAGTARPPSRCFGSKLCQAKFSLLVSSSEKRKRQKTGQFAQPRRLTECKIHGRRNRVQTAAGSSRYFCACRGRFFPII